MKMSTTCVLAMKDNIAACIQNPGEGLYVWLSKSQHQFDSM